jgi:hypothetical protein
MRIEGNTPDSGKRHYAVSVRGSSIASFALGKSRLVRGKNVFSVLTGVQWMGFASVEVKSQASSLTHHWVVAGLDLFLCFRYIRTRLFARGFVEAASPPVRHPEAAPRRERTPPVQTLDSCCTVRQNHDPPLHQRLVDNHSPFTHTILSSCPLRERVFWAVDVRLIYRVPLDLVVLPPCRLQRPLWPFNTCSFISKPRAWRIGSRSDRKRCSLRLTTPYLPRPEPPLLFASIDETLPRYHRVSCQHSQRSQWQHNTPTSARTEQWTLRYQYPELISVKSLAVQEVSHLSLPGPRTQYRGLRPQTPLAN